tara:strand:+ start:591 stop:962 length:372 start_codon:yes stop_codon:yes gene_type:complete
MNTETILRKVNEQIYQFEFAGDRKIFKFLNYFRGSVYGIRICFEIIKLHFEEDSPECTKEYLTKKMSGLASRATVINFINGEIDKGSLITKTSNRDKRVRIIDPSNELIKEFVSWLDSDNRAA